MRWIRLHLWHRIRRGNNNIFTYCGIDTRWNILRGSQNNRPDDAGVVCCRCVAAIEAEIARHTKPTGNGGGKE